MTTLPHDQPTPVASTDNVVVKHIRALQRDGSAYKKTNTVWLEGDHLCRAAHGAGFAPRVFVWSQQAWQRCLQTTEGHDLHAQATMRCANAAKHQIIMSDKLWADLSGLESWTGMGAIFDLSPAHARHVQVAVPTVIVDRVQDPGNLGSIIRTAAAMGFSQVLAIKGSVALWSPKVLRAGMGAHFSLYMVEGLDPDDLSKLTVPLLLTSSHQGEWLHQKSLPWPCAWVMGHEGQGVSRAIEDMVQHHIRVIQPGGEESLNVAAAAAVCMHASAAAQYPVV